MARLDAQLEQRREERLIQMQKQNEEASNEAQRAKELREEHNRRLKELREQQKAEADAQRVQLAARLDAQRKTWRDVLERADASDAEKAAALDELIAIEEETVRETAQLGGVLEFEALKAVLAEKEEAQRVQAAEEARLAMKAAERKAEEEEKRRKWQNVRRGLVKTLRDYSDTYADKQEDKSTLVLVKSMFEIAVNVSVKFIDGEERLADASVSFTIVAPDEPRRYCSTQTNGEGICRIVCSPLSVLRAMRASKDGKEIAKRGESVVPQPKLAVDGHADSQG